MDGKNWQLFKSFMDELEKSFTCKRDQTKSDTLFVISMGKKKMKMNSQLSQLI